MLLTYYSITVDPYELFGNLAETNKTATTELPAVAAICFCSVFLLEPFADGSCSLHAGSAGLRKASGYARPVAVRAVGIMEKPAF